MISVIIPVYNSAAYIGNTIESVLNQSFEDFELLLIDDGSKDRTRQEIQSFQERDRRIKYFYKENGGVSSARNWGIREAQGDYISFLDSDDLWDIRFLERMYRKIEEEGKLLCFCGYIEKQGNQEIRYPNRFGIEDVLMGKLCSDTFRIHTDSWLIDRQFLLSTGIAFTEGCHYLEDLEFFVKLLYKAGQEQIAFVPEYLSYYILRPDSLSKQQKMVLPLPMMEQLLEVLKRIYNWLEKEAKETKYLLGVQLTIKKTYIHFLWNQLLLGKFRDFKKLLVFYRTDRSVFFPNRPLVQKRYRIWSFCIFFSPLRYLCRIFLRPYKYLKRKIRIDKLYK